jgi:hypothetical protein
VITIEDWWWYVDTALDGMVGVVTELGDDLANQRPDVPGVNTPYGLFTHCLGVMAYWGGHVVAGRTVERDRAAEFRAGGSVDDLVARAREARRQLAADVAGVDPSAPPRGDVADPSDAALPLGRTQGGALVHIYEELAQHLGQMEATRDVLLASWARRTSTPPAPVD